MKRLATATIVLTAIATAAQAGGMPKPIRLVERTKMYSSTHYVRGAQGGSRHGGGYDTAPAEARKDTKGAKGAKTAKQDKPQAAKAD